MKRAAIKTALRNVGMYHLVRHWYRRVDAGTRKERSEESNYYRQLVGPGDLCFDIGANLGQTVEALRTCGARVVTVEPNPLCIRTLKWEFGGSPDVTIVEKAVGGEVGFADLHFEATNATGSLRGDWPFAHSEVRRVPVTTLDELIAEFGRPKLCKIDVEGYEVEVFRGLSQPIPIIRFEYHQAEIRRALDCVERIRSLGAIRSCNMSRLDGTVFVSPEWFSDQELVRRLSDLDHPRGNIVIKMDV